MAHTTTRTIQPSVRAIGSRPSKTATARTTSGTPRVVGDDLFPDMAIGRLTVQTAAEADALAAKLIAYDPHT